MDVWTQAAADPWIAVALALGVIGVGLAMAARFAPRIAAYARAVLVTAVSAGLVSLAVRFGGPIYWFAAGFAVATALHRWVDLLRGR